LRHAGGRGFEDRRDAGSRHAGAIRAQDHGVGAEAAVHRPGLMNGDQRGDRADGQPVERRARKRPPRAHLLGEREPVHVLRHHVRPAPMGTGIEDGHEVVRGNPPEGLHRIEEPVRVGEFHPVQGGDGSPAGVRLRGIGHTSGCLGESVAQEVSAEPGGIVRTQGGNDDHLILAPRDLAL
jgi:hypothetical protein